jgi:RNA polymerase sigma-70 factor, ECF subfamily
VEDLTAKIVNSVQAERNLAARQRDIYDSHRHRTFSLAYYMTGNEMEAERILAQTFIRAFESTPEPTGKEIDSALLKELRQRVSLDLDIPSYTSIMESGPAIHRQIGQNIKRTDLEEAIANLPAMERFLFLLRDVEGYAPMAIAELLRLPESYVNRGVLTARLRLRKVLTARRVAKSAVA